MDAQYDEWIASMWVFLPLGYALTILIEVPILMVALSDRHSMKRRFWCGAWLTACTYPIVVIVLPVAVWPTLGRTGYLWIAETFAPLAECLLFRAAQKGTQEGGTDNSATARDYVVITVANLCSFIVGEFIFG
jgi:hypothetical protein